MGPPPAQPVAAVNLVALVLITSLVVATGPWPSGSYRSESGGSSSSHHSPRLWPLWLYQKIVAVDPSSSDSEHIHVYKASRKQAVRMKPFLIALVVTRHEIFS